jgi:hypothetical protein
VMPPESQAAKCWRFLDVQIAGVPAFLIRLAAPAGPAAASASAPVATAMMTAELSDMRWAFMVVSPCGLSRQ